MADAELPGADMVARGLADLAAGRRSAEALLVAIGAPRLSRAGLALPAGADLPAEAELALYALLCDDGEPDPYGRYNALIRLLVSHERALEAHARRARARQARAEDPVSR